MSERMCVIDTLKYSVKTAISGDDVKIYNYREIVRPSCSIEQSVKFYNEEHEHAPYAQRGVLVFGEDRNIYLMIHDVLHAYHQHETHVREHGMWVGYEKDGYIYISQEAKRLIRANMGSVL